MNQPLRDRLFRDPIHGDIRLGPIQAAIIDTRTFQRLRYIKQNGLLHFVFPGAVHTRFAHSIGAAYVASRVFNNLAGDMRGGDPKRLDGASIKYLEQVFVTAALLHDCGHSAFSHSIEGVTVAGGESIFRSVTEMAKEWSTEKEKLLTWLEQAQRDGLSLNDDHITHEEIGLLLIRRLVCEEAIENVVLQELQVPVSDFLSDVQSLIDDRLKYSRHFKESAERATAQIAGIKSVPKDEISKQLHSALSCLISGTLDVDRMDYLLRDSHYTGTAYGVYDFSTLSNSIHLGVWSNGEEAVLLVCLRERACSAFDDFLWSRYQLFNQVLNHKSNVMLNAMLGEALEEIVDSSKARVSRPKDFKDFLAFTDEYIMSDVIVAAFNEDKDRLYARVLVDRSLPKYLGREDVTELGEDRINENDPRVKQKIEETKKQLADDLGLEDQEKIRHHITECKFLKNLSLPYILRRDKARNEEVVEPFEENDSYQLMKWQEYGGKSIPAVVSHVHYFIDKKDLKS